jgi:hypothetical protein
MLKLVSFCPETQADPTVHVCDVAASMARGIEAIAEMARTGGGVASCVVLKFSFC